MFMGPRGGEEGREPKKALNKTKKEGAQKGPKQKSRHCHPPNVGIAPGRGVFPRKFFQAEALKCFAREKLLRAADDGSLGRALHETKAGGLSVGS